MKSWGMFAVKGGWVSELENGKNAGSKNQWSGHRRVGKWQPSEREPLRVGGVQVWTIGELQSKYCQTFELTPGITARIDNVTCCYCFTLRDVTNR